MANTPTRHRFSRFIAPIFALLISSGALWAQCPPQYIFEATSSFQNVGTSVDFAGDVNNDGYDDFIIGAPGTGINGQVLVYSGLDSSLIWSFEGSDPGDIFGWAVAGAGDVDNDGWDDIVIGAYGYDGSSGRVQVRSGRTGGFLWDFTNTGAARNLGYSVDGAGDVNNDGYADIIAGAPGDSETGYRRGKAYVYSGLTGVILDSAYTNVDTANLGWAVAGIGDFDNDGNDDVMAGAPFYNGVAGRQCGKVVAWSVGDLTPLFAQEGLTLEEHFGHSVDGAGDWNNDGTLDYVIGAPSFDVPGSSAGRVLIYSGAVSNPLLKVFVGLSAGHNLGFDVSGVGDITGDGYSEIIVGARWADFNGNNSGSAVLYSGFTESAVSVFLGTPAPGAVFGSSVAGGGDFNNDGFPDVVIGAPFDGTTVSSGGRAFVYSLPAKKCFTSDWDARTGLFPDEVCPPWILSADGVPLPTLIDSVLRISLPELTDFESYRQTEEILDITYPWTLEARLQLITGSSASDAIAPAEIFFSNGSDTSNALHITTDTIFVWTQVLSSVERGTIAVVDTDDEFHTYRIVMLNPLEFKLFYDDSLLFQDSMITGVGLTSPTRISWGKLFAGSSGTSDWLFVRHTSYDNTLDSDSDGIADCDDNCPYSFNPFQEDIDGDGLGDSCYMPVHLWPLTVVARDALASTESTLGKVVLNLPDPDINLNVIDPDSLAIGADSFSVISNTIGDSAEYYQVDGNDSVVISSPKTGRYLVEVRTEAGGGSGGFYTVSIRTDGTVENVFGPEGNPVTGELDTVFIDNVPYAFGDADGSGSITIGDVTFLIARIFSGGPAPEPEDAGDADCSGSITIADVTYLIAHIFSGGPAPGCGGGASVTSFDDDPYSGSNVKLRFAPGRTDQYQLFVE